MRFVNDNGTTKLVATVGGHQVQVVVTRDDHEGLAEALARFWEAYDRAVAEAARPT